MEYRKSSCAPFSNCFPVYGIFGISMCVFYRYITSSNVCCAFFKTYFISSSSKLLLFNASKLTLTSLISRSNFSSVFYNNIRVSRRLAHAPTALSYLFSSTRLARTKEFCTVRHARDQRSEWYRDECGNRHYPPTSRSTKSRGIGAIGFSPKRNTGTFSF